MLWGVLLLTEPYVDFLCLISAGVGRPVNRAMPVVTSNEPDDKHSCESIKKFPLINVCFACFIIQDPAGIFELVEVVGNGTYGQVYKVGVSLHLFVCHSLK